MTGKEIDYIKEAYATGKVSGDGPFTKKCEAWLQELTGACRVLLTHSCTAALEMAALLIDVQPGDEVIVPSFTFVSTANAFVLRGAIPVFVDIRPDTLNLDVNLVEASITRKTRAIVPVHYAGVGCEMDRLNAIADRFNLWVVEDAAQALMATYRNRPLGAQGDLGAFSFHETKNVISGEGGALVISESTLVQKAEIIREKGTDRSRFFRGEVDKYTWQLVGSSYLPSELTAAFLWAQLQEARNLTMSRRRIWLRYHEELAQLEQEGRLQLPKPPLECDHNGHIYYIVLPSKMMRDRVLFELKDRGINAVFHYVPLHRSAGGRRYGRCHGELPITESVADRLLRLPLWAGLSDEQVTYVITQLLAIVRSL